MDRPDFAINLGNGVFLDSSGRLTTSVPANVARFALSQPLPIPRAAMQQVYGSVGSIVPQLEKAGGDLVVKGLDVFGLLGLSAELALTFGKVAAIASNLAAVVPVVNFAVALFSMLGAFNGSDPIKDLITREFDRLFARLDEDRRREVDDFIGRCLAAFSPALTSLADYQTVLSKPEAFQGPGEVARKRSGLQGMLPKVEETLNEALLHQWALPFDPIDYRDNWGYLQDRLHTEPEPGMAVPAQFPAEAVPFDHRPMVQLLVFGIQSYLTLIKAVVPEHRTTGQFHAALLGLADRLSLQLDNMRGKTLARTIYPAGAPVFWSAPRGFFVLAVGAMDLRCDTDDFIYRARQPADHPEWDRCANLYRTWTSAPAIDPRGLQVEVDGDVAWHLNPETVELANQQAERDYAAVLTRSGYFTLAHLEALMRHLATEPDRSETVTGDAETWRKPLPQFPVQVTSLDIPFSPHIEAQASREPQDTKAYLSLTTQPPGSDEAIGYRLRLLTLPNGRTEASFDEYVWTRYDPEAETRNWNLRVAENTALPLDPVGENPRLLVTGISPAQPVSGERTVTLTADTFDWYVPVPDNPIRREQIREGIRLGLKPISGPGAGPSPLPPAPPPAGEAPALTRWDIGSLAAGLSTVGFGWEEGTQTWKGEKRERQRTQVEVTCQWYWHEDRLSVSLKPRAQDRNFVIYLVVEEFLARSQQWLRTPIRIQVNGQLTYVPQSFFDAEAKARKRANEILGRIERNYSISRQPGPADPVVSWLRPGTFESVEAMKEFVELALQHAPDVVEQSLMETDGT